MSNNQVKVAVFGLGSVGKSCLSIRFVQDIFTEEYEPTIESTYRKSLSIDGKTYMIDIFDTAGMENLSTMRATMIRQRDCYILIYSILDRESFDCIQKLYDEIVLIKESETVPCIICGNKQDLSDKRVVTEEEGIELAKKLGAVYLPTSAKTGENVVAVMENSVRQYLKTQAPEEKDTKPQKRKITCLLI